MSLAIIRIKKIICMCEFNLIFFFYIYDNTILVELFDV